MTITTELKKSGRCAIKKPTPNSIKRTNNRKVKRVQGQPERIQPRRRRRRRNRGFFRTLFQFSAIQWVIFLSFASFLVLFIVCFL